MFLYNNKKTKGYKSGCIYKTRRYCFTCKQVPDQMGRQDREGHGWGQGGERAACKEEGGGGEGLLPSINLQAGAEVAHTQERSKACAVLAVRGGGGMLRARSVRLPGPLAPCSSGFSLEWGTGRRLGAATAPWSPLWKTGEGCSLCPSFSPLTGPVPSPPSPRPAEMPTGTQGEQVQQPGLLAFLGRYRR